MALPNGAGGYQVGDGNLTEPNIGVQAAPETLTGVTSVTLTAAQASSGMLIANSGTTATAYVLPIVVGTSSVVGVNDAVSSAKTNSTFDLDIINIGGSGGTITMTVGTGWTLVGLATIAISTSAQFRARKTSDTTWTMYRIS